MFLFFICLLVIFFFFFFFNDTATTEIYTLSLHDALPISCRPRCRPRGACPPGVGGAHAESRGRGRRARAAGALAPRAPERTEDRVRVRGRWPGGVPLHPRDRQARGRARVRPRRCRRNPRTARADPG